jgi:TusE/DsrC/DsvC family sulfur relay protein
MESVMEKTPAVDLAAIDAKLDLIQEQMVTIVQRQRYQSEIIDEMWPILNEVVKASTETLHDLETKGYFAFARESVKIVENVVENYSEDDVRQLGESVVGILDTVKSVTQPEVLAVANEASEALSKAKSVKPKSIFGMLKATRDADVKYGLAVIFEILRQVGRNGRRTASRASASDVRKQKLRNKLQPSGRGPRPAAPTRPAPRRKPTPKNASGTACGPPPAPTVDPAAWTKEIGEQTATSQGVELSEDHWKIIEFTRNEYLDKGASPNIRRITSGLEITTKDIYQLFPKAPARTVSLIAGIPKPAGCI